MQIDHPNVRPIDRNLLASFIEYAANGAITSTEWNRFAVNHYQDDTMEQARAECVRILQSYAGTAEVSLEDRDHLHRLAKNLRGPTSP